MKNNNCSVTELQQETFCCEIAASQVHITRSYHFQLCLGAAAWRGLSVPRASTSCSFSATWFGTWSCHSWFSFALSIGHKGRQGWFNSLSCCTSAGLRRWNCTSASLSFSVVSLVAVPRKLVLLAVSVFLLGVSSISALCPQARLEISAEAGSESRMAGVGYPRNQTV